MTRVCSKRRSRDEEGEGDSSRGIWKERLWKKMMVAEAFPWPLLLTLSLDDKANKSDSKQRRKVDYVRFCFKYIRLFC